MFKSGKSEELTNKIEQLLSGQVSLAEAKKGATSETREILDLVERLGRYRPTANPGFQTNLEKSLLGFYRRPRLGVFAFRLGIKRMKVVAAGSAAALLLLSGMALALPGVRKLIVHPPSGNVEVMSSPEKAKVYLDNAFKGTTPMRLTDVAAGPHELRVSKENHEDWSGALTVKEKKTLRVLVELNEIEVIVVKPEHSAKAAKGASGESPSEPSSSVSDKSARSPEDSRAESNTMPSSNDSSSSSTAPSSSPPAAVDTPASVTEPLPSSDSLILAGAKSLFSWGALGKKETILADTSGITEMVLSPNSSLVALVDSGTLKVVDTQSGDPKFTYKARSSIKNPRWSPDESTLLFTALDGESLKPTIFTAQISSKTVKKLVPGIVGSWSSNGQEIAYTKETGGVFLTDPEGVKEQQIVPRMNVSDLKWSPSGIKIAFIGTPEAETAEGSGLYVVNKDGTELKKITTSCSDFWWSPDGQSIALEKTEKLEWSISIVASDGTNLVSIAKDARRPRFSPDSKKIAFTKDDGIYIANLDGESPVRVLQEPNLDLVGWIRIPSGQ